MITQRRDGMTNEREKLATILRRVRGCKAANVSCSFCNRQPDERTQFEETGCLWIADYILAAGFRLVTPTSEGEAQKAARLLLDLEPVNFTAHGAQEAAKICARYILSLAPGKDVVEGARSIFKCICTRAFLDKGLHVHGCPWGTYGEAVSAFTTAHAARERADEREANCKAICAECRTLGPPEFQADPGPSYWHGRHECKATFIRARTP